jgi:hypothetical protein
MILNSVRGRNNLRAMIRLEELGQLKNVITSSGSELDSFQPVAQCLNQIRCPPFHVHLQSLIYKMLLLTSSAHGKTRMSTATSPYSGNICELGTSHLPTWK